MTQKKAKREDPTPTKEPINVPVSALTGVVNPPNTVQTELPEPGPTPVPDDGLKPGELTTDDKGHVKVPEFDDSLETENLVGKKPIWKTFLPGGKVINGATGEEWTEQDTVDLYGVEALPEDSPLRKKLLEKQEQQKST